MSKELKFLIYCLEEYKYAKNLKGEEIASMFDKYEVFDYIKSYYEALHTTGTNYIINDIDEYIAASEQPTT